MFIISSIGLLLMLREPLDKVLLMLHEPLDKVLPWTVAIAAGQS